MVLEEQAVGKDLQLLATQPNVSDTAISKLLQEDETALQTRQPKKHDIHCSNLPAPRVHRFIVDVVAMKGNNAYILETLFWLFHGKVQYKHKIDVAREVTHQARI